MLSIFHIIEIIIFTGWINYENTYHYILACNSFNRSIPHEVATDCFVRSLCKLALIISLRFIEAEAMKLKTFGGLRYALIIIIKKVWANWTRKRGNKGHVFVQTLLLVVRFCMFLREFPPPWDITFFLLFNCLDFEEQKFVLLKLRQKYIKKKGIFLNICFLRCRLRIWNPILGVGIGNPMFSRFFPYFL